MLVNEKKMRIENGRMSIGLPGIMISGLFAVE
jgi:hypothetical protein